MSTELIAEKQGKERGLAGAPASENPHTNRGLRAAWLRGLAEGLAIRARVER